MNSIACRVAMLLASLGATALAAFACFPVLLLTVGDSAMGKFGDALRLGVGVLIVMQFDWKRVMAFAWRDTVGPVLVLAFLVGVADYSISKFVIPECEKMSFRRAAFGGSSDAEILTALTRNDRYYPRADVVFDLRSESQELDSILYYGDLRPDPANYLLYPRRIYVHPELQRELLIDVLRQWSDVDDPGMKWEEQPPAVPVSPDEVRKFAQRQSVKWVLECYSMDRERDGFRRWEP